MPKKPDEQKVVKEKVRALIMAGYSADKISETLGFSNVTEVRAILDEMFTDEGLESVDDKRRLDNQRLEEMMAQFWYRATGKVEVPFDEQISTAKICLRIMRQKAKLLGLNKDPRIEAQNEKNKKYTVIWDTYDPLKKDARKKRN